MIDVRWPCSAAFCMSGSVSAISSWHSVIGPAAGRARQGEALRRCDPRPRHATHRLRRALHAVLLRVRRRRSVLIVLPDCQCVSVESRSRDEPDRLQHDPVLRRMRSSIATRCRTSSIEPNVVHGMRDRARRRVCASGDHARLDHVDACDIAAHDELDRPARGRPVLLLLAITGSK